MIPSIFINIIGMTSFSPDSIFASFLHFVHVFELDILLYLYTAQFSSKQRACNIQQQCYGCFNVPDDGIMAWFLLAAATHMEGRFLR